MRTVVFAIAIIFGGMVQAQTYCPGGVCPVPVRASALVVLPDGSIASRVVVRSAGVVAAPVIRTVRTVSRSHWTYPGDIYSHIAGSHGVSAAGMSRDEAESLHDRLHESSRQSTVYRSRSVTTYRRNGLLSRIFRR